jgi:hypothetical protein
MFVAETMWSGGIDRPASGVVQQKPYASARKADRKRTAKECKCLTAMARFLLWATRNSG